MTNNGFNLVRSSLARKESSVTSVGQLEPSKEEIKELFAERITSETELPPMQPLFRMFGVPCFYRGELVADCGKAKSGKTFFLSILMATCLTQKVLAIERHVTEGDNENGLHPLRVLWIDTEQSQQSTQEILRDRIIPLSKSLQLIRTSTLISMPLICVGWVSTSVRRWSKLLFMPSSRTSVSLTALRI